MRTFYTASDIEDLAARGATQLDLGPGVMLTAAAKERAEELHIALVTPGSAAPATRRESAAPAKAAQSAAAAQSGALPAKPRGCQHGSLGGASGKAAPSQVVEQLVDAVSALKKRGG